MLGRRLRGDGRYLRTNVQRNPKLLLTKSILSVPTDTSCNRVSTKQIQGCAFLQCDYACKTPLSNSVLSFSDTAYNSVEIGYRSVILL